MERPPILLEVCHPLFQVQASWVDPPRSETWGISCLVGDVTGIPVISLVGD